MEHRFSFSDAVQQVELRSLEKIEIHADAGIYESIESLLCPHFIDMMIVYIQKRPIVTVVGLLVLGHPAF
jgi:hypothetical protein